MGKIIGTIILKGDNNWKTWGKKWVGAILVPTGIGLATATLNYIQVNPLPIKDPVTAGIAGLVVTVALQVLNLIKHA